MRDSPHRPGSREWWIAIEDAWHGLDDIEQEVIARRFSEVPYLDRPFGQMEEISLALKFATEQVRVIRDSAVAKIGQLP